MGPSPAADTAAAGTATAAPHTASGPGVVTLFGQQWNTPHGVGAASFVTPAAPGAPGGGGGGAAGAAGPLFNTPGTALTSSVSMLAASTGPPVFGAGYSPATAYMGAVNTGPPTTSTTPPMFGGGYSPATAYGAGGGGGGGGLATTTPGFSLAKPGSHLACPLFTPSPTAGPVAPPPPPQKQASHPGEGKGAGGGVVVTPRGR